MKKIFYTHKKEYIAFTLAEVLITLAIIGIIAAMTIPNLMQSWKKHEVEGKVKEAYSLLNNAVKMAVAENGNIEDWTGQSALTISKYLKISSNCGTQAYDTGDKKNCFSWRYLNEDANGTDEWGTYDSIRCYQATLQNGMRICLDWEQQQKNLKDYYTLFAAVDINGNKKIPVVGKDIFFFTIDVPTNTVVPGYLRNQYNLNDSKRRSTIYFLNCTNQYCCNLSARQGGGVCTNVIAKNGWKIPENYPIKKW